MTVKTGPLASGGIDMERALVQYLKERSYTLAGRKVELFVGDSGGVPAQSRTKTQELVERDKIHVMIGPLDTASALATDDYIRQAAPAHLVGRGGGGHDPAEAQSRGSRAGPPLRRSARCRSPTTATRR